MQHGGIVVVEQGHGLARVAEYLQDERLGEAVVEVFVHHVDKIPRLAELHQHQYLWEKKMEEKHQHEYLWGEENGRRIEEEKLQLKPSWRNTDILFYEK